jgi:hypothetical protein
VAAEHEVACSVGNRQDSTLGPRGECGNCVGLDLESKPLRDVCERVSCFDYIPKRVGNRVTVDRITGGYLINVALEEAVTSPITLVLNWKPPEKP